MIQPATLDRLLDHVVALARQLKVARGRQLRVDSTVVGTAIRHPTDSGLLTDAVRMLGRMVRRARPLAGEALAGVRDAFRTRTRSARRQLQRIHRLTRRKGEAGEAARRAAYARLCQVARTVVRQAERVRTALTPASAEHAQPASKDEIVLSPAQQGSAMIETQPATVSDMPQILRVGGRIAARRDRTRPA